MAYRKRSLDLPSAPTDDSPQSLSKHPRSSLEIINIPGNSAPIYSRSQYSNSNYHAASVDASRPAMLPPIRSLDGYPGPPLPLRDSAACPAKPNSQQKQLPPLAAIRMTSPAPSSSQSAGSPLQHQLGAASSSCSTITIAKRKDNNIAGPLALNNNPVVVDSLPAHSGALLNKSSDSVKVARNWSREETLSLVRAIGRHYDSLKRCKTNQERSNVWHRIHKEHSSQFPGRSKKASQDRWGKVLSDYKDVMVHNKEKGAARWTFDFFKEVAAIVEGDSNYMEHAKTSPPSVSSASVGSSNPTPLQSTGIANGYSDDLNTYSFSNPKSAALTSSVAHSTGQSASANPRHPPMAQHRMSEPNLLSISSGSSIGKHNRGNGHWNPPSQPQAPFSSPPPQHCHSNANNKQPTTPLHYQPNRSQQQPEHADNSSASGGRYSPTRRTSYPQMQGLLVSPGRPATAGAADGGLANSNGEGRGGIAVLRHYPPHSASGQLYQRRSLQHPPGVLLSPHSASSVYSAGRSSNPLSANTHHEQQSRDNPQQTQQQSPLAPLPIQPKRIAVSSSSPTQSLFLVSPTQDTGNTAISPPTSSTVFGPTGGTSRETGDAEQACRYVLDMLEQQVRRIDVQQETLTQLKESAQDAISKVERVLQHYVRPPTGGGDQ
ncbi:hypothetical protein GGI26_005462 [Coemansia sp. RSA 1358]|nr:hypothetical protein EDC05_005379 [Coemansia umbellata]KAJ2619891.1 hypothetical protein GGI26_005462 [Coemansia sp. RSA 1358]